MLSQYAIEAMNESEALGISIDIFKKRYTGANISLYIITAV